MKNILAFLSFLIFIQITPHTANTVQAQKTSKLFDSMLTEAYPADEPGATALVAQDGEVIYRKGFGMANLELGIATTPDQVFEIGSITKQFTAVSILMLMEHGKLSLDDEITKFITDYPTHGHKITIHHLLTHTSGIKSYTSMEEWYPVWRKDFTSEELVDFFKHQPMDFAPGEKFLYNNSAYFLLGVIIENISGLSYADFLDFHIFKPLNMTHSLYGSKTRIVPNRASGYQKREEFINAAYLSMSQPGAAGAIMSTVDDMFTWQQAIRNNSLVKVETIELAFTNYTLNDGSLINYGYGWMPNEINGSPTLEHGGGIFGYTTNGIYLPDENVYVIVLTNRDDKGPSTISTKMAAMAIDKPYPQSLSQVSVDKDILESYTGVYEFEDGSTRYITFKDGQLHSQRAGSILIDIFPVSETQFYYDGSLSTIEFSKNDAGNLAAYFQNRIDKTNGIKTDKELPNRQETEVDRTIMEAYVGEYEIQPGFTITVTMEDGHLMTQATGQEKFEVFPESKTKFFLKVVDAQIEFLKDATGNVEALMLYQAGQEIRAAKIR